MAVIYSSPDTAVCITWRINDLVKWVILVTNDAIGVEFGSANDGEDGEHNDGGFVEIPMKFTIQDDIYFEKEPFDGRSVHFDLLSFYQQQSIFSTK